MLQKKLEIEKEKAETEKKKRTPEIKKNVISAPKKVNKRSPEKLNGSHFFSVFPKCKYYFGDGFNNTHQSLISGITESSFFHVNVHQIAIWRADFSLPE